MLLIRDAGQHAVLDLGAARGVLPLAEEGLGAGHDVGLFLQPQPRLVAELLAVEAGVHAVRVEEEALVGGEEGEGGEPGEDVADLLGGAVDGFEVGGPLPGPAERAEVALHEVAVPPVRVPGTALGEQGGGGAEQGGEGAAEEGGHGGGRGGGGFGVGRGGR